MPNIFATEVYYHTSLLLLLVQKVLFENHFSGTKERMNPTITYIKELISDPRTRLWGGIVLVTVLLTSGLYFLSPHNQTLVTKKINPALLKVRPTDWVRGNPATAKATLIEYSDFQCPACGAYYGVLRQLETDLGKDIAVVYRHFPLLAIHQNAELGARAAEAAGAQGKFFEMHDMLFAEQKTWGEDTNAEALIVGYAQKLGLDVERFKTDLHSDTIKKKIDASVTEGNALDLKGTPSFFMNGTQIPPAKTYAEFKNSIVSVVYKQ